MNNDGDLIWEAYVGEGSDKYFPSIGSHEKGKAMELIKLYMAMVESDQMLTVQVVEDTLVEAWTVFMEDPDVDADQVLNHVMDQQPGEQEPGMSAELLSAFQDARANIPPA